MQINTDIYGLPSTWYYPPSIESTYANYYNNNAAALSALSLLPAKSVNFGGVDNNNKGSLERGINQDKTPQNTPIDNSIVVIGQDRNVSAMGSMKVVNITHHDTHYPDAHTETITKSGNVNTFFSYFYCLQNDPAMNKIHSWFNNKDEYNGYIWSPDSTLENNPNNKIFPVSAYESKSMLLVPMVLCASSLAAANLGTWRTLDDWKNNYNTTKIYGIALSVSTVKSLTNNTISYTDENDIFNIVRRVAASIYDDIDNFIDYTFLLENKFATGSYISLLTYNGWSDGYNKTPLSYRFYFPNVDLFDNCEQKLSWELLIHGGENLRVGYEIGYSDHNYETIMKMTACFGVPFSPDGTRSFATTFDSEKLYFPIIDENGVTHGNYTHGSANLTNPFNTVKDPRNYNYDPTVPVDPNQYSNITSFNTLDTNAALTKFYVLDKTNVEKLGDDLWTICDTISEDDFNNFEGKIKDEFLTTNPIDSIISLKRFPFDVPHTFSNTKVNVQLGKSEGTAQGYRTFNVVFGVDFKGIDIFPRFGNSFLDYSPYTKYELYIPFCGIVEIDPGDILGHKLNLQLRIDLFTGSVIAYIMADSLVVGTANGSCALEQVLSGTQSATLNSQILNGIINLQTIQESKINQAGKTMYPTGLIHTAFDPFGRKENFTQLESAQMKQEVDLTHIIASTHKMGTASPMLAWIQEFNARLMIYYPEGDVINNEQPPSFRKLPLASFGHLKGFATVSPGKVSSFQKSGQQCYLRGDILADLIPCTDNERKRIRAALADGVFLPALTE